MEVLKTAEDLQLSKLETSLVELREVFRKHQHYIKETFKITDQEMEILQFVAMNGRKKMKEIGESFNIKLSTLTNIIDKIERQKIVKRVNSKEDRRAVYLELTPKGEKIYEKYSHYIHVMALIMRRTIKTENFDTFVEELARITQRGSDL